MLKGALATAAVVAGGAAWLVPRRANAYYSGPVSDHFDGLQFFNPGGRNPPPFPKLWNLYFGERWATWPAAFASPYRDRPPRVAPEGRTRIVHVGHASWLIQAAGRNILVDPHWSDRASPFGFMGPKRVNPPGIAFEDLPPVDTVLVTHNHYDHLDLPTLERLWARERPRIVTPLGNDALMRPVLPGLAAQVVDWWQSVDIGNGVRVHAVPTSHWSARGLRDRRHALWASFVIETPSAIIYAVGDTGFGAGRTFRQIAARFPRIDLALLPIGAYEPRWFMREQHMNPDDAAMAFELSGAKAALGHHWGTFQLTTERHDQPPADLVTALAKRSIAAERFVPVRPGQVREI